MVSDTIQNQMRTEMDHYKTLAQSFEKFFNYEELGHIIDRKADKKEVQNLEKKMAR